MATSAFRSASRRANSSSSPTTAANKPLPSTKQQKSTQKVPLRRSRSVSAFSRTHLDVSLDFQNKRDNPLFWVDESPKSTPGDRAEVNFSKLDEISSKFIDVNGSGGGESRRGRTVSRNSCGDGGGRKEFGRSLSRVDTARRRRSPSRRRYGNSEGEKGQPSGSLSNFRTKSKIDLSENCSLPAEKYKLGRSTSDLSEILKGLNTWSSQRPAFETSDDSAICQSGSGRPHLDDGVSTCCFSEVEEKTIKPVSEERKIRYLSDDNNTTDGILETVRAEVRRAMFDMQNDLKNAVSRSNSDIITSRVLSDTAPKLAHPNVMELMRDMRGEYARELEECEERTRKLQAELAVEEHRGLELNQILNSVVPEPKAAQVQKPRAVRKASMERKKMSKRLEEEALAYFDECVSISTFDDSDFSSLEDPPSSTIRVDDPGDEAASVSKSTSRANVVCPFESQDLMRQSPLMQRNEGSNVPANCSCNNSPCRSSPTNSATKPQISSIPKPSDTTSLEQDIRNYVKKFSKDSGGESSNSRIVRTGHENVEDYNCEVPIEKRLLDRVTFRSRIESGSMLLCGWDLGSLAPFSSVLL